MKLALSIPLVTTFTLIATVLMNVGGVYYSLEHHMPEYIKATEQKRTLPDLNLTQLQNILSIGNLDTGTQEDYHNALVELSNITDSLQAVSKNPELYVTNTPSNANPHAFQIHVNNNETYTLILNNDAKNEMFGNIFSFLFSPHVFKKDSPESVLLSQIFYDFLFLNILWLAIITLLYFLWIRSLFSPIHLILHHLEELLQNTTLNAISYTKKNEFRPLIDALNKIHNALVAQDTIRSNFLADLSHEIRTPITAVKCLLEAIEDGLMQLDDTTLTLLQNELSRMVTITENIMEYESFLGKMTPDITFVPFSLNEVSDPLILQYGAQGHKTNQHILNEFPKGVKIMMDQDQYIQILHNIFSNFMKYAGPNSTLHCSYTKTKTKQILKFWDDGVGMNEHSMLLAASKFFKGDPGRTQGKNTVSMGIGISIIERIMTLHHGSLKLTKTHPHGFTLILSLPFSYV